MTDTRPCKGDAFVKAGPRLRREDCENCENYRRRGGKCLGHRGWKAAREAGVKLEGEADA
jgi:hypothetical protein